MHSILGLGANHVLFAALISWFVAQALKIPIYHHVEHVWDFSRFHGSGGMPSSHSAMVTGTAIMIGGLYGFDSGLFALSVVVAMIVMYDAAGVRRETGTQATVINQILKDMLLNGKKISDEEKEYKTLRKQIQEKLIKFATRIPIFMYLTDYREQTMIDVITNLEPDYFKKVTGLDTRDFELLMSLGVFNESLMNDAVYKFKRYEDSSLSYTGINRHAGEKVGLFSTVVDFDEMFADQQSSMEAPPADDGDMPENPFAFVAEEEEDGEEPPVPEKPAKKRGGRNGEVVVIHPAAAANRAPKEAAAVSPAAAKPAPAPAVPAAPPKPSFDVSSLSVGTAVLHKAFGVGTITEIDPDDIKFRYITVAFPDTEKRFQIPNVFLQGFLKLQ